MKSVIVISSGVVSGLFWGWASHAVGGGEPAAAIVGAATAAMTVVVVAVLVADE